MLLLFAPYGAYAAYLYFSPSAGSYAQGENFVMSVLVSSDKSINAVRGVLTFPTEYLGVISISQVSSIINLWVQAPSFSNVGTTGNVRFEGVILNPGFKGVTGRIVDVVFRIKKQGVADIGMSEFAILANDGKGTNIATSDGDARFTFLKPVSPQEKEKTDLEKKINDVEEKVKILEEGINSAPVIIIQKQEPPTGILGFWEVLPQWIKIGVTVLIGVAVILLGFIVVSFGIIILIWIWNFTWRRKSVLGRWFASFPRAVKRFMYRVSAFIRGAEKEIEGDLKYSTPQIKKVIKEARRGTPFKKLVKDYFNSIRKIVKRFSTKNESWQKVTSDDTPEPNSEASDKEEK